MSCTCGCREQEADERTPWWVTLGMSIFALLIADLYAHPLGGRTTRAERERFERTRDELRARRDF